MPRSTPRSRRATTDRAERVGVGVVIRTLASGLGLPVAVAVALVAPQAACSTTYQPRAPGQVSMVIHGASAMFIKDGVEHPVGPFTGELEALVRDTPEAVPHARSAHLELTVGIPTYVAGAAGVVVGILALSGPVGWVVIGVGACALSTGLGLMGAAFTHAVDAVNLHNDGGRRSESRPPADLRP